MPEYPNNEFISACLEFDQLLAHLAVIRGDHFGADPESDRTWAEVGSVREANRLLRQAVEFLTGTAP